MAVLCFDVQNHFPLVALSVAGVNLDGLIATQGSMIESIAKTIISDLLIGALPAAASEMNSCRNDVSCWFCAHTQACQ